MEGSSSPAEADVGVMKAMAQAEQRAGCFLCFVVLMRGGTLNHYCREKEGSRIENGTSRRLNIS